MVMENSAVRVIDMCLRVTGRCGSEVYGINN